MRSFRCNSIEEGIAIDQELSRLDRQKERREALLKIKYGHDFGHNRKCDCGLMERDYYITRHQSPDMCCPNYNKKELL